MWDTRNQQAPPHARKPKQWDGYADHGGFDDDWGRADARRPKSAPRDDRGGGRREDDFFDEGRRRSSEFSRREGDFLAGGGGSSAAAPRSIAVSFFDDGKQRSSMDRPRDGGQSPSSAAAFLQSGRDSRPVRNHALVP